MRRLFSIREIRFLFVGGLNTLVGYGTYAFFIYIGLNYFYASTLSTIIGIIHSYIWNRNFTFKSKKSIKKEIVKFVCVYGVSYVLGLTMLHILVDKLDWSEYFAGLINLAFTTLISWFGHKNFSFRGNEK